MTNLFNGVVSLQKKERCSKKCLKILLFMYECYSYVLELSLYNDLLKPICNILIKAVEKIHYILASCCEKWNVVSLATPIPK